MLPLAPAALAPAPEAKGSSDALRISGGVKYSGEKNVCSAASEGAAEVEEAPPPPPCGGGRSPLLPPPMCCWGF